jgi:hypothetical protein
MAGSKPGQGDLWLCMDRRRQPVSLNRTAVGGIRAYHRLPYTVQTTLTPMRPCQPEKSGAMLSR